MCKIIYPGHMGKYKDKLLYIGINIALVPDVFQNIMSKLVQYNETYLVDLSILTNSTIKDYLLRLEKVILGLSSN
jgi:hypothetical protein